MRADLDRWQALKQRLRGPLSLLECSELARVASSDGSPRRALEVGHYQGLSTCVLLQSLPAGSCLTTIDHHKGDTWCPPSDEQAFRARVAEFAGQVSIRSITGAFEDVHDQIGAGFDFVFYDADHSRNAVASFWRLYAPLFAPECVVVFDDADWIEQSQMRALAEGDGFRVQTAVPFNRTANDKNDPLTYTLEVMAR